MQARTYRDAHSAHTHSHTHSHTHTHTRTHARTRAPLLTRVTAHQPLPRDMRCARSSSRMTAASSAPTLRAMSSWSPPSSPPDRTPGTQNKHVFPCVGKQLRLMRARVHMLHAKGVQGLTSKVRQLLPQAYLPPNVML